jgi:hypothetical protein
VVRKAGSVFHKLRLSNQVENSDGMLYESMQLLPLDPRSVVFQGFSFGEPLTDRFQHLRFVHVSTLLQQSSSYAPVFLESETDRIARQHSFYFPHRDPDFLAYFLDAVVWHFRRLTEKATQRSLLTSVS